MQIMKKLSEDQIVFQEYPFLVVNKPAGIAVQSASQESLLDIVKSQFNKKYEVINRIDQVVSGLVLFCADKYHADRLNQLFKSRAVDKTYYALVEKKAMESTSGELQAFLYHNTKKHKAFVVDESHKYAKSASLKYELLAELSYYNLLKIQPKEGRFHHIRALLAHHQMPVKGDVKYGARRKNKDRSIHLHAYKLRFHTPIVGDIVHFIAPLPTENLWNAANSTFEN